ncbi:MAG: bifunctional adenosylcobinamide kinase/adenosylcobinamide-phosphate guanylyltransferase [Lachnospiraceae bacterium]|nr:bifunctional adenosylcobinamide kinase/adenosylcobinamide-phosphate guanylyltransferase [Lachnospiraceae bacterium]
MITLVIGKPDSGKSLFAEDLAVKTGLKNRYYIATMVVCDEDGIARIKRHRRQRKGKGFVTLEIATDIEGAADQMDDPDTSVAVLECVTNLTANLLFGGLSLEEGDFYRRSGRDTEACKEYPAQDKEYLADVIVRKTVDLAGKVAHLIVVSGQYEAAPGDDEETAMYKTVLDMINTRLCKVADIVYDMKDMDPVP